MIKILIKVYKKLYLIRYTEEIIRKKYPQKKMKTPTHLGIGQEAISTGVALNLKNDSVFCHHRSHLLFLALDGSVYRLFCELMGKKDGVSGGKGGSYICRLMINLNLAVPLYWVNHLVWLLEQDYLSNI